jgi:hypothetical protein
MFSRRCIVASMGCLIVVGVWGTVMLRIQPQSPFPLRALTSDEMKLAVGAVGPPCGNTLVIAQRCHVAVSTGACTQGFNTFGIANCCTPTSVPGNALCPGQNVPTIVNNTNGYSNLAGPLSCTDTECVYNCLCSFFGTCSEDTDCAVPKPSCGSFGAVVNCGTQGACGCCGWPVCNGS